MSEFNFTSPTGLQMNPQGYGIAQYGDNSALNVTFYTKSALNEAISQQQGTPYHESKVFVRIFTPGELQNIIDRPAKKEDSNRWPRQWQDYLHNRTQIPDGTPLELLFPNNPAIADNLKVRGVHTVQQLSNLTANAIDSIGMGAQEYVNRAKRYIENAKDGTEVLKLMEESKKKDMVISRLEMDMASLKKQINILMGERNNPRASISNPTDPSYDPQTSRINAKHISSEISSGNIIDPIGPVTLANMEAPDGSLFAPTIQEEPLGAATSVGPEDLAGIDNGEFDISLEDGGKLSKRPKRRR